MHATESMWNDNVHSGQMCEQHSTMQRQQASRNLVDQLRHSTYGANAIPGEQPPGQPYAAIPPQFGNQGSLLKRSNTSGSTVLDALEDLLEEESQANAGTAMSNPERNTVLNCMHQVYHSENSIKSEPFPGEDVDMLVQMFHGQEVESESDSESDREDMQSSESDDCKALKMRKHTDSTVSYHSMTDVKEELAGGLKRQRSRTHEIAVAARMMDSFKRLHSDSEINPFQYSSGSSAAASTLRTYPSSAGPMDGSACVPPPMIIKRNPSAGKAKVPWTPQEERALLHLVYYFVDKDLRTISNICQNCDIHRSTRAVDKKLKRVVIFDKWHKRDPERIRETIRSIIVSNPLPLSPDMQFKITQAVRIGRVPAAVPPLMGADMPVFPVFSHSSTQACNFIPREYSSSI